MNFVEPNDLIKALAKTKTLTVTTDYNRFNVTDTPFVSSNVLSRVKDTLNVKRLRGSVYEVSRKS